MKDVFLIRFQSGDQGTKGVWIAPGFEARSIELPWKNNAQNISCISDGSYLCQVYKSSRYGKVYQIKDVQGRTWILIHWGNWAGDESKGFRSDSNGCIIMGQFHGLIYGQEAVGLSRVTTQRWMNFMMGEDFMLHISSIYDGGQS